MYNYWRWTNHPISSGNGCFSSDVRGGAWVWRSWSAFWCATRPPWGDEVCWSCGDAIIIHQKGGIMRVYPLVNQHSYWNGPFDFPIKVVIFHIYVCFPEGSPVKSCRKCVSEPWKWSTLPRSSPCVQGNSPRFTEVAHISQKLSSFRKPPNNVRVQLCGMDGSSWKLLKILYIYIHIDIYIYICICMSITNSCTMRRPPSFEIGSQIPFTTFTTSIHPTMPGNLITNLPGWWWWWCGGMLLDRYSREEDLVGPFFTCHPDRLGIVLLWLLPGGFK